MAIITLQKKELKKLAGNVSDEKLDYILNMFGLGVEKMDENTIDIEVTPNRPDMLSQPGIFRALESYLGKKKARQYKLNKPERDYEVKIDKSVRDIRPYTACAIIKNLKLDSNSIKETSKSKDFDSAQKSYSKKISDIIDIQESIHSTLGRNRKKMAIGIYPLEKISLPIRYEARKPENIKFIPLDATEEMNALQILQRHPTGREYAHLLEHAEKYPVFVDSKGQILSLPPIINSSNTGRITEQTKEAFIECSGFDLNALKKALNILVTMLADMGCKIYQMRLDYGSKEKHTTPELAPEKIKISSENVNKLLGLELKETEIKNLLQKMGCEYNNNEVLVPAWRTDIMHEVDVIEDIAIAYGYDKFIPEIPQISTIGEEDKKETAKRKIAEILVGLNMLETSSLHLLTKDDLKRAGIKEKDAIEVENSKTDYKFLRQNLLCPALKALSENVDVEYPQKIFELGRVFKKDERAETGISEKENLVAALSPGNFTGMKQVIEYLGRMLNRIFTLKEAENSNFIDGRCGKILCEDREIGIIGEIHPSVLKKWRIKMPVAAFEVCVEEMI